MTSATWTVTSPKDAVEINVAHDPERGELMYSTDWLLTSELHLGVPGGTSLCCFGPATGG